MGLFERLVVAAFVMGLVGLAGLVVAIIVIVLVVALRLS